MTKTLIVSLIVVAAGMAATAFLLLGTGDAAATAQSPDEDCIGCHTSLPLLVPVWLLKNPLSKL